MDMFEVRFNSLLTNESVINMPQHIGVRHLCVGLKIFAANTVRFTY